MSFLIFAYRKLDLTRRINEKNYRLMLISNEHQRMVTQIGNMQQCMSATQNTISMLSGNSIMNATQQFQATCMGAGTATDANTQMQAAVKFQAAQQAATYKANLMNSVFDVQSKTQLAQLNAIDTQLTMEMKSLESQLKPLSEELTNVEKAEGEAAKQAAPKFGQ